MRYKFNSYLHPSYKSYKRFLRLLRLSYFCSCAVITRHCCRIGFTFFFQQSQRAQRHRTINNGSDQHGYWHEAIGLDAASSGQNQISQLNAQRQHAYKVSCENRCYDNRGVTRASKVVHRPTKQVAFFNA